MRRRTLLRLAGAALVVPRPLSAAGAPSLRHAPPAIEANPIVVDVPVTGGTGADGTWRSPHLPPDRDVILRLPTDRPREGTVRTFGGRHLRVIGGVIAGGGLNMGQVSGSAFVEGVYIDTKLTGNDACAMTNEIGARPDLYVQNCRFDNIHGDRKGLHGDGLQLYKYTVVGGQRLPCHIGRWFVDRLTVTTDYQGMFLSAQAEDGDVPLGMWFSRVNFSYHAEPVGGGETAMIYMFDHGQRRHYPKHFDEVYIEPRPGRTLKGKATVFPSVDSQPARNADGLDWRAKADDGDAWVEWPQPELMVRGRILRGPPPGGDFVQRPDANGRGGPGRPGIGYASPGYARA